VKRQSFITGAPWGLGVFFWHLPHPPAHRPFQDQSDCWLARLIIGELRACLPESTIIEI